MPDNYKVYLRFDPSVENVVDMPKLIRRTAAMRYWHEAHRAYDEISRLERKLRFYDRLEELRKTVQGDLQSLLQGVRNNEGAAMIPLNDFEPCAFVPYGYMLHHPDERLQRSEPFFTSEGGIAVDAATLDGKIALLSGWGHDYLVPFDGGMLWLDFRLSFVIDFSDSSWRCTRQEVSLEIEDVAYGDQLSSEQIKQLLNDFFAPKKPAISA